MIKKYEGCPVWFSMGAVLDIPEKMAESNPVCDRVNYIRIRHLNGHEQNYLVDKNLKLTVEKSDEVIFEFIMNEYKNFYKLVSIECHK